MRTAELGVAMLGHGFMGQAHSRALAALATIEELAQRIAEAGGRMRSSRVWPVFEGEPYRTCYCEDPFGNVVELYSHSHERTYANRDGAA